MTRFQNSGRIFTRGLIAGFDGFTRRIGAWPRCKGGGGGAGGGGFGTLLLALHVGEVGTEEFVPSET